MTDPPQPGKLPASLMLATTRLHLAEVELAQAAGVDLAELAETLRATIAVLEKLVAKGSP